MNAMQQNEAAAKELAALNGRDWSDMGDYERQDYRDEAAKPMSKDMDRALFSAAAHVISEMWGDTMGDMQVMSLANQIVREIERRQIVK